jgi:drug/metabolite transporter (DMT)-like permease
MLLIRYLAAISLLLSVVVLHHKRRAAWSHALRLWAPVTVWYAASAVTFSSALRLVKVTQVAPIAYLYPAIAALIGAVFHHGPFGRSRLASVCCSIAGSARIFGILSMSAVAIGVRLLAVATAVTSGSTTSPRDYDIAPGRTVRGSALIQGTVVLTSAGSLVILPAVLLTGSRAPSRLPAAATARASSPSAACSRSCSSSPA